MHIVALINAGFLFSFEQNQDQRTLDVETAVTMIHLLLHGSWPLLDDFLEFLQVCTSYCVLHYCNVSLLFFCSLPECVLL